MRFKPWRSPSVVFVGASGAMANNVALPSHQAGDLIVVSAFRVNGGTTLPTTPGGWTDITSRARGVATAVTIKVAYKFAASGSEVSGTWTNATGIQVAVYRNVASVGLNPTNNSGGTSLMTWPAMTVNNPNGRSWVVAVGIHVSAGITITPPSCSVRFSNTTTDSFSISDTNGVVSEWASRDYTSGSAESWLTASFELIP